MAQSPPSNIQASPKSPKSSRLKKLFKFLAWIGFTLAAILLLIGLWAWFKLHGSLAILDGELELAGLEKTVTITRDGNGVPTLTAKNQLDLARAMGFTHAQERFIQMDGLRRLPAGELSAIFGRSLLRVDKRMRRHHLREIARNVYQRAPATHRRILEAYADGVNQGLERLKAPPFEYVLLRTQPQPWRPEDSALVIMAMALDLQDESGNYETALGSMRDTLPAALFEFLTPWGSEWDAPLMGGPMLPIDIPGPDVIDLRAGKRAAPIEPPPNGEDLKPGSNNWAVGGALTPYRSGMLANDMHLGLRVPQIWYRARLIWTDSSGVRWDTVGATLPGTPTLVVGSNGHIAWGFTNSYLDWSDVIILESPEGQPDHYLTPDGPKPIARVKTIIGIKGEKPVPYEFEETEWGPVIRRDHLGRRLVVKWVMHDPNAVNFGLIEVNTTKTAETAMRLANRCGIPGQNFVVTDSQGHLGWTIAGLIPKRVGFDGRFPTTWSDGSHSWDGWLSQDAYPSVYDPDSQRIWTANARVVSEAYLKVVGESGYALGARARQIRDRLMAGGPFREKDLLNIQLDDEALFLERWRQVLLSRIQTSQDPEEASLRELVENWGGHAKAGSAGYRLVRHFRANVCQVILKALTATTYNADPDFSYTDIPQYEGLVWKILQERPSHLLPPAYPNWEDLLNVQVDRTIEEAIATSGSLKDHTWGRRNTLGMTHSLSGTLTMFAKYLDMPAQPLDGDSNMPRVQGRRFGASERMVVAPGHEDQGIFHMPGGQSAHPLSPFYKAGHRDWVEGNPSPLLPGAEKYRLLLQPNSK